MKDNFSCTLTGAAWWKPMLGFFVLFLAVFIPYELAIMKITVPGAGNVVSSLLFILVMLLLLVIIGAACTIILLRIVYPTIQVRNEAFSFNGNLGAFIKLYLIGTLLTVITLGFYFPWFTKKITDFIAVNSKYRDEAPSFKGTPGKLMKYYLLGLWVPLIVWGILVIGLAAAAGFTAKTSPAAAIGFGVIAAIAYLAIFIVIAPFYYLSYKWYVNITWKDIHITWKTEFWPSCLFLAGQTALSVITLGIYLPAFMVKAWRYFAAKTVLETDGEERARLGFEGKTGTGFALIWGQMLLSMITMGIYLPWAYAACIRFFITGTFIEDKQVLISK